MSGTVRKTKQTCVRLICAAAVLLAAVLCSGCPVISPSNIGGDASEVIEAMISSFGSGRLPVGEVYRRVPGGAGGAGGGEPSGYGGVMSDEMTAVIFGGGRMPEIFSEVEDCAVWLALTRSPVEFAVFLVSSKIHTDEVAAVCAERLEMLRRYYGDAGGADALAAANDARVCVIGRYVVMVMSPDNETAIRAAEKAIK